MCVSTVLVNVSLHFVCVSSVIECRRHRDRASLNGMPHISHVKLFSYLFSDRIIGWILLSCFSYEIDIGLDSGVHVGNKGKNIILDFLVIM